MDVVILSSVKNVDGGLVRSVDINYICRSFICIIVSFMFSCFYEYELRDFACIRFTSHPLCYTVHSSILPFLLLFHSPSLPFIYFYHFTILPFYRFSILPFLLPFYPFLILIIILLTLMCRPDTWQFANQDEMDPDKSCYVRCSAVDAAEGTLTYYFLHVVFICIIVCIIVMSNDEILHRIVLHYIIFPD